MVLTYKMEDLEKLPKPSRHGKKSGSVISMDSSHKRLYLPTSVTNKYGLKEGDGFDLRFMPNGKGLVMDRAGDDFHFTVSGKSGGGLSVNATEAVALIYGRFKTTKFDFIWTAEAPLLVVHE